MNLEELVSRLIDDYDEEYKKEIGLDDLDDEDVRNIVFNILDNIDVDRIIHEEIEDYANFKKSLRGEQNEC